MGDSTTPVTGKVKIRKQRELVDEKGHWLRHFTPRTDPWPEIEFWALQQGYALGNVRGKHRFYSKAFGSSTIIVDIKEHEGQMTIASWVRFGLLARLFWRLPRECSPLPSGLAGAVSRRQASRDLNALLTMIRQPVITGSLSWHIGDLDVCTLWLAALSFFPIALYALAMAPHVDWHWRMLPALATILFRKVGILLTSALLMVVGYEFLRRRFFHESWMRKSVVGLLVTLSFVSVGQSLWRTRNALNESKVAYYCLTMAEREGCLTALDRLSPARREMYLANLKALSEYLATRSRPARRQN